MVKVCLSQVKLKLCILVHFTLASKNYGSGTKPGEDLIKNQIFVE